MAGHERLPHPLPFCPRQRVSSRSAHADSHGKVKLAARKVHGLSASPIWEAGTPLWKVVPKRDETGKPYVDFMMLAPGLNRRPAADREGVLLLVRGVLERFGDDVVFADFNLDINVLWVSLRCQPGLMSRVVCLLRAKVPMLRLVGHSPDTLA